MTNAMSPDTVSTAEQAREGTAWDLPGLVSLSLMVPSKIAAWLCASGIAYETVETLLNGGSVVLPKQVVADLRQRRA